MSVETKSLEPFEGGARLTLGQPDYSADPTGTLREIHRRGAPLWLRVPFLGSQRAAYRHEDVLRVLRDTESFAVNPKTAGGGLRVGLSWWMPKSVRMLTDNMLGQDDPEHKRLRRLVNHAFNRRGIAEMETRITTIATDLLALFPDDRPADFIAPFARRFPLTVIQELLGISPSEGDRFQKTAGHIAEIGAGGLKGLLGVRHIMSMNALLREELDKAKANPGDGLISELLQPDDEGERLTPDELLTMAFLLLFAGHETTVHLLALSAEHLIRHNKLGAFAGRDPRARMTAVDELMRLLSPVEMTEARYARHDLEIAGHTLKRGTSIVCFLAAANRDPDVFSDPDTLDLDRTPNPHVGFGAGVHFCLGAQLARIEAATALSMMFDGRTDWSIADGPDAVVWKATPGLRGFSRLDLVRHRAQRQAA